MASSSDESTDTRLLKAALIGNLKLLKKLAAELDYGEGFAKTFVGVKDAEDRTALHFAAVGGRTRICKYLIEELKLDVNMKDGKGATALLHATLGQHFPTTVYLLENGANPTLADDKGFSALHFAADKGCKELMRLLISKGAEVDAKSDFGTPLQCAAAKGKKEAIKILLDNNANPNSVCHHIFTPLAVSILAKSFECSKMLLKARADPNLGSCGVTPLGIAASEGETEVIKCLLKAGANPNFTNYYGLTPLEIAALHGNHDGLMILFPVTSQIPTIPNWSVGGIIKHIHSKEAREQREHKEKENFLLSKSKGEDAFKRKDYVNAIYWYTQAINADPSDATVLSNRSLCWACLNEGRRALSDAEACVLLRPNWPKAYYREGVAWKLLKNFVRAADSFSDALKLDPENEELQNALREAVQAEFGVPLGENLAVMHL
ncbi:hypothetical protein F0562_021181 [Nyssa sinensis]|uniref:Serine/threonine-protein kinase BSK1-like TPR repeats domain-containing protein n=1 Tax=Nyssa sinensis TaxID=561372 RepID=A0A5J5BKQ6_9ASTE|nr:hypothetical protein F0562_021181 [Nyssa sinensis]